MLLEMELRELERRLDQCGSFVLSTWLSCRECANKTVASNSMDAAGTTPGQHRFTCGGFCALPRGIESDLVFALLRLICCVFAYLGAMDNHQQRSFFRPGKGSVVRTAEGFRWLLRKTRTGIRFIHSHTCSHEGVRCACVI